MVMAIMALIMALAGAAIFQTSRAGLPAASAAVQLRSLLSNARELAITTNTRTRVAFVTEGGPSDDGWAYRACVVLQRQFVGGGDEDEDSSPWRQVLASPVEMMPSGIYFDPSSPVFGVSDLHQRQGGSVAENFRYGYVEFQPTGGTTQSSAQNIVVLIPSTGPGEPAVNPDMRALIGVARTSGRIRIELPEAE